MEKDFENSAAVHYRERSAISLNAVAAVVLIVMSAGLIVSIFFEAWGLAAIFAISLAGTGLLTFRVGREMRGSAAAAVARQIGWEPAQPEMQRQSLHVEVLELSRILEAGHENIGDLQSAYIVAEDLALRQIQQEESVPVIRHVGVCKAPFDAVFIKGGVLVCADVCFLLSPELRQERIDAMLKKIERVKRTLDEKAVEVRARLMIILITQLSAEDDAKLRGSLGRRRFISTPVDVEIRMLDFEALQRIYVTD